MPRKRFIDKKSAQTFALVHRAQNDPLIHDASASSMVFKQVAALNSRKIKTRADLDAEFAASGVRANEGEAANYGVFYDDTEYDYMQHMRDLGQSTDARWVESSAAVKDKGKGKVRLEDALREVSLDDIPSEGGMSLASSTARSLLPEDMLPSEFVQKRTYQDQQDTPDALAGFQPDMDPRLREVLEALEDEAYVDDEEDDIFAELAGEGEEVDRDEWEAAGWDDGDGDAGWETDDTIKPENEVKESDDTSSTSKCPIPAAEPHAATADSEDHGDGVWLAEFSKFKKEVRAGKAPTPALAPSDLQPSIITGTSSLINGRRKKRKGALSSSTGYSMTSSALFRTTGQTLLDGRFDKIEEDYAESGYGADVDDSASVVSGMSRMSGVSKTSGLSAVSSDAPALPPDFDSIMDDFLGGYSMGGKRRVKKGGQQTGMEQLDEIRKGLGPARIRSQKV